MKNIKFTQRYPTYDSQPESHKITGKEYEPTQADIDWAMSKLIHYSNSRKWNILGTRIWIYEKMAIRFLQEAKRLGKSLFDIIDIFEAMLDGINDDMNNIGWKNQQGHTDSIRYRHNAEGEQMIIAWGLTRKRIITIFFWTDFDPRKKFRKIW